jgi:chemotaxis protein CheY-P-specific phosphatase CheC
MSKSEIISEILSELQQLRLEILSELQQLRLDLAEADCREDLDRILTIEASVENLETKLKILQEKEAHMEYIAKLNKLGSFDD